MNGNDLNRNNDKKLYKQVQDFIMARIKDGTFKAGEAIPTEKELYEMFKVSRYTVRRAIEELVHKDCLYRVQGSGTFVLEDDSPRETQNNSIGVVLTHCEHEMEANILNGIEKALQEEGYMITFVSSKDDYKKEAENIQRLKRNGVNGLIIMPAEDQKESNVIFDLKNEQFPFVLVDRRLQDCETDCVMSDNILGGYKAAEHLIELGHKKVGFVKRKFSRTSSINDRIIGYKSALRDYGLDYDQNIIFSYDEMLSEDEIYSEIFNYIKKEAPTGIFAINDFVALDILKMSRVKGISVPDDLSIIGFDNLDFAKHLEVPITTIAQFSKDIGFEAAKLLINIIKDRQSNKSRNNLIKQIYFPVELIVRDSCKKV